MEDEKLIELLDERFSRLDDKFAHIDDKFAHIDERFARIDERFDQIDERFDQIDEKFDQIDEKFDQIDEKFVHVDERFREASMSSERLENEIKFMGLKINNLDGRIERLTNEVKLPSGIVAQRITDVREQVVDGDRHTRVLIEKLHGKVMAVGEQVDLVDQKLARFRSEIDHT